MRMACCFLAAALAVLPAAAAGGTGTGHSLVFVGPERPVLVRVHIELDGKPVVPGQIPGLDALFTFLDRDGDGVLGEQEVKLAPRAQVLAQLRMNAGQFFNFGGGGANANLAEMDSDKDGEVSAEEFADYYARAGQAGLQITPALNQGTPSVSAVTDELYKLIDRDGDGKLSRAEIEAAAAGLARADQNDNELVDLSEILPNLAGFGFGQAAFQANGPQANNGPLLQFHTADVSRNPVAPLFTAYDKDGDQKLSRAEIKLVKTEFDALDANQDDLLDQAELLRFANRPTDWEFLVRLGHRLDGFAAVEYCGPSGRPLPAPPAVRPLADKTVQATVMELLLNLRVADPATGTLALIRQNVMQQFKAVDQDKNGILDKKELQNLQRAFVLRPILQFGDVDGDGQLTEKEVTDFLDMQDKLITSNVTLQVQDNSQGLFELLDGNRDGNLGLRELRTAWQRLASLDRDGDGCIARGEIPRQVLLSFNAGAANNLGPQRAFAAMFRAATSNVNPVPTRGPLWFRKMDRNGDGDVSAREFLGSAEDFKQIDLDGDGLIDLAEAEKADTAVRKAGR